MAPELPIVPEPTPEQLEELEEESLTEIEAVGEQLALHSIESEARHEQILEAVEVNHQCLLRLEQSNPPSENPASQAMITELATVKTELAEVKGMLTAIMASLAALNSVIPRHTPNPSPEANPEPATEMPAENPSEQKPEESTAEPAPGETQRKKHRIL